MVCLKHIIEIKSINNESLSKRILKDFEPQFKENDLTNRLKELNDNNFEVIFKEEYFPYLLFFDVGAIVYFAKIIEWEFPNFSVDSCFNVLCDLQKELNQKSYIESLEHRFIILSKNIK